VTGHRKIWITLIIASAFFLIANAPASILKPYLKNSLNFPFELRGTVMQGEISSEYFQKVSWQVSPLYLLLAKVSAQIRVKIDSNNQINAVAEISPFSKPELKQVKGEVTTQYLQKFWPATPFLFNTTIQIKQANIKWDDGFPTNLPAESEGSLALKKVNLLGEDIGDYQFGFKYLEQSLVGNITSTSNSPLDTVLKLNISPQNLLTLTGEILPKTIALKLIFKELNINLNPNISYQLPPIP
jgi:hypothetical protein